MSRRVNARSLRPILPQPVVAEHCIDRQSRQKLPVFVKFGGDGPVLAVFALAGYSASVIRRSPDACQ